MATFKLSPVVFRREPGAMALKGKSVLIVEDEPVIALDVHAALNAAGASIIAATNSAEALELIRYAEISVAVLDVKLGDRDCSVVCQALFRRGTPFLFHTGFASAKVLEEWPNAPVLTKPARTNLIVATVAALVC
jgi:DNA-binding response OmpR family regulator